MDQSEHGRIGNLLTERCPDQVIEPWPETPPAPPPTTSAATTAPAPPPRGNCDASYPTVCIPPPPPDLERGEIEFRRFAVEPPDPHGFDGNEDGVGCEG
jgi:micrococcal nuclease